LPAVAEPLPPPVVGFEELPPAPDAPPVDDPASFFGATPPSSAEQPNTVGPTAQSRAKMSEFLVE
jgi:hypothetical protein